MFAISIICIDFDEKQYNYTEEQLINATKILTADKFEEASCSFEEVITNSSFATKGSRTLLSNLSCSPNLKCFKYTGSTIKFNETSYFKYFDTEHRFCGIPTKALPDYSEVIKNEIIAMDANAPAELVLEAF